MASWKSVLDAVLDLYDDISVLLRDLDFQLDRYGYGCIHARHYGFEGTAVVDRPRAWLPTWFARLYARQGEAAPRRLLGVAVLLHPEGLEVLNPSWGDPQPPILLGSVIRYKEPPEDRWELRHALLWLQSGAPLDGTVQRFEPPRPPSTATPIPPAGPLIEHADVMALPLETLRTGEDLRALVIDPLRRLV